MGLEEEFGLFERTGKPMGLISGKPKRKLRRLVTRPVGFLLKPIGREIKRRARKKIKKKLQQAFKEPRFVKVSVKEALKADKPEVKSIFE